jgi:hypothetical protein
VSVALIMADNLPRGYFNEIVRKTPEPAASGVESGRLIQL